MSLERMEVSLLEKVKSAAMWAETWDTNTSGHLPTIDTIRKVCSDSKSSSSYCTIPDLNITKKLGNNLSITCGTHPVTEKTHCKVICLSTIL